jgi:3-methyladenine DNA glycosylase AlkD
MEIKYTSTSSLEKLAAEIERELESFPIQNAAAIRKVIKKWSRRLEGQPVDAVLALVRAILNGKRLHLRWIAFGLIWSHKNALASIGEPELLEFGKGIDSWGAVDAFAGLLAGPAWMHGQVPDSLIQDWARSSDRWWRRCALVCTVVLNTPSHGGKGDTLRTLKICSMLIDDRDDMVVKALSWALRKLSVHDPDAVREFLKTHESRLAARVKRETRNKLETGLKNPRRSARAREQD